MATRTLNSFKTLWSIYGRAEIISVGLEAFEEYEKDVLDAGTRIFSEPSNDYFFRGVLIHVDNALDPWQITWHHYHDFDNILDPYSCRFCGASKLELERLGGVGKRNLKTMICKGRALP